MKINNLSFAYAENGKEIFKDFNWELDNNNVHFIMGENGSGKTTFYEIISGLLPYKGTILNKIHPKNILFQLQHFPLLKEMRGKELVELIIGSDGKCSNISLKALTQNEPPKIKDKVTYLWHSVFGKMSVGERQWLIIYLFCKIDRELYIFDEPTAGLDLIAAKEILEMIQHLVTDKEKKVMLTTHRIEELNYFSDYTVTILKNGENYFTGSKETFERSLVYSDYVAL